MRKPRRPRRRGNPGARVVQPPPDDVDVDDIANNATYVSSPYHSLAVPAPRPRPDATLCPLSVSKNPIRIIRWLRDSIRQGRTGSWSGNGFPKYVWHRVGDVIYEAREGSPGTGIYHGYPLDSSQTVRGLP